MNTKLIFLLVFIVNLAFSQDDKPVLGSNFHEYTKAMDTYYESHPKGRGSGLKQYMRWRYKMAGRVGVEGLIQNFDALNQAEYNKTYQTFEKGGKIQATHGLWEDIGPHDYYSSDAAANSSLCRVNCIAFHPTNANILWVGAPSGGLWKTTDHGGAWTCISNNFASCGISDIVVQANNPDIIYVLTGDSDGDDSFSIGVMKTIDGGTTWKETGLKFGPSQGKSGYRLLQHPNDSNILIACFEDGIYKTINGGDYWVKSNDGLSTYDIEFKPGNPTIIYAASNLGIFKSTNTGDTFLPSNTGFPLNPTDPMLPMLWVRLSLAVSAAQPNYVYVLCGGGPGAGQYAGMYRSTDSGGSWTVRSTTPNILGWGSAGEDGGNQAGYDLAMDVNPADAEQVFIGGINGWRSNSGGSLWSRETNHNRGFGAVDPFVHADWHTVKYRGSRIYSTNDGGVWYSDDAGNSWGEISSGIGGTQFYNIDVKGTSWIGGTQDNGTNEGNVGNIQMHNIGGGDGFGAIWHKTNNGIKFICSQNQIVRRQDGIPWTLDSEEGKYWYNTMKNATDTHVKNFCIQYTTNLVHFNPINDITINEYSFYNTHNSAQGVGGLMGYSQGTNNANIMYAAHYNNILKHTNIYGATSGSWTVLPQPDVGISYDDIIVDPANSQRVWVVVNGYVEGKKVYFSSTGGSFWTNISGSLPNVPVRTIELQDGGGDRLYIGTEIGIFYRAAGMTDWVYYSNNMPNVPVFDLRISGTYLYAGTHGRGIWRSELYSVCPLTLALTPANETITNVFAPGKQEHSASQSIQSTRIYNGSVGTEIHYNGGNFVELKSGFEIKKDAFLLVKNNGCPN